MQNLELLKQQLITQKEMLESKGITVTCAHTNPSPTELTTAISHISPVDMSLTTVTPADVANGKKYYDSTGVLQTGTFVDTSKAILDDIKLGYLPESFSDERFYRPYVFTEVTTRSKKHIIPSNITELPEYTFYKSNIEEIVFPEGFTTVNTYCFDKCLNLKKLIMPDTITTVASFAFQDIRNITELHISTGLTSLPNGAMRYLEKLTEIHVPANITSIGLGNFQYIASCQNLYIEAPTFTFPYNAILSTYPSTLKIWIKLSAMRTLGNSCLSKYKKYPICQYEITDETEFPDTTTNSSSYSIVWYGSLEDASNRENEITAPNGAGTYYARLAL